MVNKLGVFYEEIFTEDLAGEVESPHLGDHTFANEVQVTERKPLVHYISHHLRQSCTTHQVAQHAAYRPCAQVVVT